MKNFVQPGDTLTITAPADATSGLPVIAGSIIGIAAGDAASGSPVDVVTTGVFSFDNVAADAFALGDTVYWSATSKLATATTSGNSKLGVAVEAAAASTATDNVRLSGF